LATAEVSRDLERGSELRSIALTNEALHSQLVGYRQLARKWTDTMVMMMMMMMMVMMMMMMMMVVIMIMI
jgi:hypothetical protein